MSRLELDVTSIPTLTNGGLVLILLTVLACVVLAMLKRPPRWRCSVCGTTFARFAELVDHEDAHCSCRGPIHHPSCKARPVSERRAAA